MAPRTLSQATREARVDAGRVHATTEAEIDRHAREDVSETPDDLIGAYPTPATVRRTLGLTQPEIAALLAVPVATWRNWEQGRVGLDPAVRTLLRVLWREPEAFRRAVAA